MIEEIKDFVDDVKDKVGDKGFYAIIAVVAAFGIYQLAKGNQSEQYTAATGYADYPSVGENAEVVIDSLSKEIWGSSDQIVGTIDGAVTDVIKNNDDHFEETNNYIKDSLVYADKVTDKVNPTVDDKVSSDNGMLSVSPDMLTHFTPTRLNGTNTRSDISTSANTFTPTRLNDTNTRSAVSTTDNTFKAVRKKPKMDTVKQVVRKPTTTASKSTASKSTASKSAASKDAQKVSKQPFAQVQPFVQSQKINSAGTGQLRSGSTIGRSSGNRDLSSNVTKAFAGLSLRG